MCKFTGSPYLQQSGGQGLAVKVSRIEFTTELNLLLLLQLNRGRHDTEAALALGNYYKSIRLFIFGTLY